MLPLYLNTRQFEIKRSIRCLETGGFLDKFGYSDRGSGDVY